MHGPEQSEWNSVPCIPAKTAAMTWLENFYQETLARHNVWIAPHITVQDGDISFEWWYYKRTLSVYVSTSEAWFLQSAGPASKQLEGSADTADIRQNIWQWLTA